MKKLLFNILSVFLFFQNSFFSNAQGGLTLPCEVEKTVDLDVVFSEQEKRERAIELQTLLNKIKDETLDPNGLGRHLILNPLDEIVGNNELSICPEEDEEGDEKLCKDFLPLSYGQKKQILDLVKTMTWIEELSLSLGLEDVPVMIKDLKKLRELFLDNNFIEVVPDFFATLGLSNFDFSNNKIKYLPTCLKDMKNLEFFLVEDNPLQSFSEVDLYMGRAELYNTFRDRVVLPDVLPDKGNSFENSLSEIQKSLAGRVGFSPSGKPKADRLKNVAVIDTEFFPNHPMLRGYLLEGYTSPASPLRQEDQWIFEGFEAMFDDLGEEFNDDAEEKEDNQKVSHGTAVASVISQFMKNDAIKQYPISLDSNLNNGRIVNGLIHLENQEDIGVINISMGVSDAGKRFLAKIEKILQYLKQYKGKFPKELEEIKAQSSVFTDICERTKSYDKRCELKTLELAENLAAQGKLVVFAGGNMGELLGISFFADLVENPQKYPNLLKHIILVGATSLQEKGEVAASFTAVAAALKDYTIFAPGVSINAALHALDGVQYESDSVPMSGTSLSAPIVSALLIHLVNEYPELTPAEVRECLFKGASKTSAETGQPLPPFIYGQGFVNMDGARREAKALLEGKGKISQYCINTVLSLFSIMKTIGLAIFED